MAQTRGHVVDLVLILGDNGLVTRLDLADFVLYVLVNGHIWKEIGIDAFAIVHELPVAFIKVDLQLLVLNFDGIIEPLPFLSISLSTLQLSVCSS